MKVIGLTGRIGCGKSTVAAILRERGVAVVDADEVAREIRRTDDEARAALIARFGSAEPAALAAVVFQDPAALADLEAILHPRVRDVIRDRLAALAVGGVTEVVVEAVKLIGSPLHERCTETWVVVCRDADARARLRERGVVGADAAGRLASQVPEAELRAAADVVIDGSAAMTHTERQVVAALRRLRSRPVGG